MARAREAILARGGAVNSNVFTRVLLSLYGILPWRSVPEMPVEIMLLPRWFPFHLTKVSYWARTVLVPLLVLQALKPQGEEPARRHHRRIVRRRRRSRSVPARKAPHQSWLWFSLFAGIDAVLRPGVRFIPKRVRARAIARAVAFVSERLNGQDGLGAIFPAMANSVLMYDVLGDARTRGDRARLGRALAGGQRRGGLLPALRVAGVGHRARLPGLAGKRDAGGGRRRRPRARLAVAAPGARRRRRLEPQRPGVAPGGWAFQYANPHYPDLDDTAVAVMAMDRARRLGAGSRYDWSIARAAQWVRDLQSSNGGWAAFDVDNTYHYLNNIPSPTTAR